MKHALKKLGHYVKRYAFQYFIGILSLIAVDFFNTLIPQITGLITDGLASRSLSFAEIQSYAFRIFLMGVIIALGRFSWRFFLFGPARSIEKEIRNDMFGHLEYLSDSWFHNHKTGDLMAHFTNDLQAVRKLLGGTIITTIDASVMLLMVLYGMIQFVSPKLTIIAVIPLILIIFGDVLFGKVMHRRFLARQEAFSKLSDSVQESISGIRVIKAFVQERKELIEFSRANQNAREKNLGVVRLMALVFPLLDFVIGISTLLTLIYGGRMAIYGEITVGQFVAFNSYVTMLVWPMIAAGECVSSLSQGFASMGRICGILDETPEISDHSNTDRSISALSGTIDFDHLTFAYPSNPRQPVLKDITVHIATGETFAIIGRTGCGKTTMVNLLSRLYKTSSDMIRIDGHPLSSIPLHILHTQIAYVPQDSFLFSETVSENIRFGAFDASPSDVILAAQAACVHDNIQEFPQQYETKLGERGVTVSGGQKQRIAIARALLIDAPILILDDSLSAVDTDTEEQILRNLRNLRKNKTTIIIASRISTIQHADHILVLEDGRIAEYGNHQELLAHNGIYASIYHRQQLEQDLREGGDDL